MRLAGLASVAALLMAAGGCSVATSTYNSATATAGTVVGSIGTLAEPESGAPPPATAAASMGTFLDGPVGARLGDADRARAFQAEEDALATGDRRTWRGVKGNYGFVALAGASTLEGCRDFTHTIYIAGRPVNGKGTGCKAPDGTWHVTG